MADKSVKLLDYRDAAIEELKIDTSSGMTSWFNGRWEKIVLSRFPGVAKDDDTIRRIMGNSYVDEAGRTLQGKHKVQQAHLEILHLVLGLNAYGLTVEEMWKAPGETTLRLGLEEFRQRLRQARGNHDDPLHNLRTRAEPGLGLRLARSMQGPGWGMPVDEIRDDGKARPVVPPSIVLESGKPFDLQIVTQVAGRILVLSHVLAERRVAVINERLGLARNLRFPRLHVIDLRNKTATGDPGPRELFVINWPDAIIDVSANLDGLFGRRDVDIHDDELRSIGAEILASGERDLEGQRVSASIQRYRMI